MSDSGSETGASVHGQVRSNAVKVTACGFLTRQDTGHQVVCCHALCVVVLGVAGSGRSDAPGHGLHAAAAVRCSSKCSNRTDQ